jgi:hypothetical protein
LNDVCIIQRDRYGGGCVMVWAGVSLHIKTDLIIIRGNLTAVKYQRDVINPVTIPHLQAGGWGMILMHDGAPEQTAHATRDLLQQQNIQQLPWPFKFQNLNVIGQLWDELNMRVRRLAIQPLNLTELEQALVHA